MNSIVSKIRQAPWIVLILELFFLLTILVAILKVLGINEEIKKTDWIVVVLGLLPFAGIVMIIVKLLTPTSAAK
jgi:hypothetical protein